MSGKVYSIVTERVLRMLEQGTVPWKRPWRGGAAGVPRSLASGKPYRGINPFLLAAAGYDSPYWLTWNQAKKLGGRILEGEARNHAPVFFWKWLEVSDDQGHRDEGQDEPTEPARRVPLFRYFRVYNLRQCKVPAERLPDDAFPSVQEREIPVLEVCERIAMGYRRGPSVAHTSGARAFYRPSEDAVHLPPRGHFDSAEEFYSTLFHELGHSTGHPTRLARESLTKTHHFGDHSYSQEELVAEFCAAFLCGTAGIEERTLVNSTAYIDSWHRVLKMHPKWLATAAQQAQKAADLILGVSHDRSS